MDVKVIDCVDDASLAPKSSKDLRVCAVAHDATDVANSSVKLKRGFCMYSSALVQKHVRWRKAF